MGKKISPLFLASFWMGGALLSFIAMAVSGREVSVELNTFQILFYRSLVSLILVAILLQIYGWDQICTKRPVVQLIRNIFHYGGQYGWFFGLAYLPLAEVFAIEFTLPVWTVIIAFCLLGEKIDRFKLFAVGLGFLGVLVILRPGVIPLSIASLAVLGGAVCYAMAYSLTKFLTRTDSPLCIIFYMTVIQLPLGFAGMYGAWHWPGLATWPWLILLGSMALSAHYCMARAFQLADATLVVPMDFLRLPLVALVGYFFYQEALDIWVIFGAALVFAGNYVNLRAQIKMA